MTTRSTNPLPPNPYSRQPIRRRDKLAGRSEELNRIQYYLRLLGAGNVNHLALIGERGSGKTSILNAAETIATELSLLPIRINLDQGKSSSPGVFWSHLYAAMLLAVGKANCWGGQGSPIYAALFQMINARVLAPLELAVLQLPVVIASHKGALAELECVDSLIVHDFEEIAVELEVNGYSGVVLLIDEGDCLGANKSLIQMFRNIFQQTSFYSLVLAGTDAIFPTLTDVFSPIPRQFHRISVTKFSHPLQTSELIRLPLQGFEKPLDELMPDWETEFELHSICSGDPQELQLYCHHMYRAAETAWAGGNHCRMSLLPEVFREVLGEYRANAPSSDDQVLDAIINLPDDLLFKSSWLSCRRLQRDEAVKYVTFKKELAVQNRLDASEFEVIKSEIEDSYKQLFKRGISSSDDRLDLKGAPLTAGFWKSHVAAQKKEIFSWDDDSFLELMYEAAVFAIGEYTRAGVMAIGDESRSHASVLASLRAGLPLAEVPAILVYVFAAAVRAHRSKPRSSTNAMEVKLNASLGNRTRSLNLIYVDDDSDEVLSQVREWVQNCQPIFATYGMAVDLSTTEQWLLPTNIELHRLARIAGVHISESEFGPARQHQAFEQYHAGNFENAAAIFTEMVNDKEDCDLKNNACYCLALAGHYKEAAELLEPIDPTASLRKQLLARHNLAVLSFVCDRKSRAVELMEGVWRAVLDRDYEPTETICMMVLTEKNASVSSIDGLSMEAACAINCYRMGSLPFDDAAAFIQEYFPDRFDEWLYLLSKDETTDLPLPDET